MKKKPCKYIRANYPCPFGTRCHFRHDITVKSSDTTPKESIPEDSKLTSQDSETPGSRGCDSRTCKDPPPTCKNDPPHRRRRRPPVRNAPKHPPSSTLTHPPSDDHTHTQTRQSNERQSNQIVSREERHSKTPSSPLTVVNPKQMSSESRQFNAPATSVRSQQPQKSGVLPANGRQNRGPSELVLGSFLTSSVPRPSVERPRGRGKRTAKTPSASELREVSQCMPL